MNWSDGGREWFRTADASPVTCGARADVTIVRVYCSVAREALSARIDGEAGPVPAARVDEHLESCADCSAWFDRACELSLRVDLSAITAPDLTADILRSAAAETQQSGYVGRGQAG